jgi:predicted Zn finger-like uncharacterized protein
MFTVCPKCALTLVVTAADLRVAQGYVRCGRCSSVFNALAQLSDERAAAAAASSASLADPPPDAPAEPQALKSPQVPPSPQTPQESAPSPSPTAARAGAPSQRPAAGLAPEDPIPEDALEFNPATDASSVFVTPPPNPEWTAATGSFKALVAANQESTAPDAAQQSLEPVDVELDAALLSDIVETGTVTAPPAAAVPRDGAPARTPPRPAAPASARATGPAMSQATAPARPQSAASAAQRAATAPRPPRATHARPASGAAVEPAESAGTTEDPQPRDADAVTFSDVPAADAAPSAARVALPWTIGAAFLALVLIVQMIDHQRDALATDSRFGAALTALYGTLGVHLVPRWDLRAYDVRQLGATAEPGSVGAITVRASIRNVGGKPQPLPLLRVTLQDRFGNRLASREVPPHDYLPPSVVPPALLSVDQRIDAQLAFVDPGTSAVGFELDACLPSRGGGVACANDTSAR